MERRHNLIAGRNNKIPPCLISTESTRWIVMEGAAVPWQQWAVPEAACSALLLEQLQGIACYCIRFCIFTRDLSTTSISLFILYNYRTLLSECSNAICRLFTLARQKGSQSSKESNRNGACPPGSGSGRMPVVSSTQFWQMTSDWNSWWSHDKQASQRGVWGVALTQVNIMLQQQEKIISVITMGNPKARTDQGVGTTPKQKFLPCDAEAEIRAMGGQRLLLLPSELSP